MELYRPNIQLANETHSAFVDIIATYWILKIQ